MLISESRHFSTGVVVLTDIAIVAAATKASLNEIAKQAYTLGIGLQDAAPGDRVGASNPSIQYLLAVADSLRAIAEKSNQENLQQILEIAKEAAQADEQLRTEHKIGDKFKFVRDRLHSVVKHVEDAMVSQQVEKEKAPDAVQPDEVLVYVYLFNVHGLNFATWQKMISPSVFYEYSVNRPIYSDKAHVEAFIRNKSNKHQHGYLVVAVKKELLLGAAGQDAIGNPLIKIREGALKIERLIVFHHHHHEYVVDSEGEVVRKDKLTS